MKMLKLFFYLSLISSCAFAQSLRTQVPTKPKYLPLRYEEDYSYLRADSLEHGDYMNKLKYIQLDEARRSYLSLGGEYRMQYERFEHENWGALPAEYVDDNGQWLQRVMFHSDWHFGKHLRIFMQLNSAALFDRLAPPRPQVDKNELDLHQAFIDIVPIYTEKHKLTARAGRCEMAFGAQRFFTVRDLPNNRQNFEGLHLLYNFKPWKYQFHGFLVRPIDNRLYVFDDNSRKDISLWGGYNTIRLGHKRNVSLHCDLYYIGQWSGNAIYYKGKGAETRHMGAIRLYKQGSPAFNYDLEFARQVGFWGNGTIWAYYAGGMLAYRFSDRYAKPTFTLNAHTSSGDQDLQDGNMETFNGLFGRPILGASKAVQEMNISMIRPAFSFQTSSKFKFWSEVAFVWRTSDHEAIYNPLQEQILPLPNKPRRSGTGNYIGTHYSGVIDVMPDAHLTTTLTVSYFTDGEVVKNEGGGKPLFYISPKVLYRF